MYYESKEDLKKLKTLINIYLGVPLKFYFGPQMYSKKMEGKFFDLQHAPLLMQALKQSFQQVEDSADEIYEWIKDCQGKGASEEEITVDDLLSGLDENKKDVIEEKCVELFTVPNKKRQQKGVTENAAGSKQVKIPKKKFKEWWTEGNLDAFETIKYYMMEGIISKMKEKLQESQDLLQVDRRQGAIQKFQAYQDKKEKIQILDKHFENNFAFIVKTQPQEAKQEEAKKKEQKGATATDKPEEKKQEPAVKSEVMEPGKTEGEAPKEG